MQKQLFKVKVSEAEVMKALTQYLDIMHINWWRNNSGSYENNGRYIKFGKKGSSDILAVYPGEHKTGHGRGRIWCIEAKKPGGLLSDDQVAFLKGIRGSGGVVTVAEGVMDIERQLNEQAAPNTPKYEVLLRS